MAPGVVAAFLGIYFYNCGIQAACNWSKQPPLTDHWRIQRIRQLPFHGSVVWHTFSAPVVVPYGVAVDIVLARALQDTTCIVSGNLTLSSQMASHRELAWHQQLGILEFVRA